MMTVKDQKLIEQRESKIGIELKIDVLAVLSIRNLLNEHFGRTAQRNLRHSLSSVAISMYEREPHPRRQIVCELDS